MRPKYLINGLGLYYDSNRYPFNVTKGLVTFAVMRLTLKKQERLKSKKLLTQLFEGGNSLTQFPLRLIYLKVEHASNYPVQVAFSVPKRKFKRAVDRNRIKRLMRESYRQHKHILYHNLEDKYILMCIYIDEKEHKYVDIKEKMILLLKKFVKKIN